MVVVGGGITGLVAAWRLATAPDPPASVTLVESERRLGGRIRTSPVEGIAVDEAADAFLLRVPWALDLCRELGLADRLVHPATRSALVVRDGALLPFPAGHLLGVPTDLDALRRSGVVSDAGVERAVLDLERSDPLPPDDDPAVGALIRRRLGDEVAERLVGPLVGGINAGDPDRMSVRAVTPQIAVAAGDPSLIAGARRLLAAGGGRRGHPVFATLPEGIGHLVGVVADRVVAAGVDVRAGVAAETVVPGRVTTTQGTLVADAVVLATPAPVSLGLLAPDADPRVTAALGAVPTVSVSLLTLVFDRAAVGHPLGGSGFLVPPAEGAGVTACSFGSSKWPHWAPDDGVLLRVSVGRDGDQVTPALPDDELVDVVVADLTPWLGLTDGPRTVRISRWVDSFPQYRPGHLDRLRGLRAALTESRPGLFVAGASYEGVGVPACVDQGERAARAVLRHLA